MEPPSSASSRWYKVFISFDGEDTPSAFASHLREALIRKGIFTFMNNYKLVRGGKISRAIEKSDLSLVIFSENYVSWVRCLDVLIKIMKCKERDGHFTVPVFYKISLSEVRRKLRRYGDAIAKLHPYSDLRSVQMWRKAVFEAAAVSGWHSSAFSSESEFIAAIATYVQRTLDEAKSLIGIDEHIARVESMLCNESANVRTIGIWGMGGIGKTTIARAVFRKLNRQYESSCFVANVREECQISGRLSQLQNKLSELSHRIFEQMPTAGGDPTFMSKRIRSRRVLIVLDDVKDSKQLKHLAGKRDQFGPGSRIIVISRDKGILSEADEIYEVKEMEFHHAFQLFSMNAFKQIHPLADFIELSEWVVNYSKGIPLALKVLGSFLFQRSLAEWESALDRLARDPVVQIQKVLRLSYDELHYTTEKNIFLDIACFYKGEDINRVKILLDGCNFCSARGLVTLHDKSLITISSDNKVSMHGLLQQMGQEIIRQESYEIP